MNGFEKVLNDVDEFCKRVKIKYAVMGGMAVLAHGISRSTDDVDINILVRLEDLSKIGEKIITCFQPLHINPIEFFEKNFVLPVTHSKTGIGIDFAAGLSGFDETAIKRSKKKKFFSLSLPCITIEDLIIYKLFAARDKDLLDLKEIAKVHKEKIDRIYLKDMLVKFAELERTDMEKVFEKIFKL